MKIRHLLKNDFIRGIIVRAVSSYLKFVFKTSKFKYHGKETIDNALKEGKPLLFCFWHENLALMPFAWKWDKKVHMLLSKHEDGQIIGNSLKRLGNFDIIFGSTNRDGFNASMKIIRLLKSGIPVGITPDGPRGPRRSISYGTSLLAFLSKADVIPISCHASRKKVFSTWDKFCFPLPFSKCSYSVGKIIKAPKTREDIESFAERLKDELDSLL